METLGEHLGIVVRRPDHRISSPIMARSVLTAAFYKMWKAGYHATTQSCCAVLEGETLEQALSVYAGFAGHTVQFAQMLQEDPSTMLRPPGPVFAFKRIAKSIWALSELLHTSWLPNLKPLHMDDQTWELFLQAVQISQNAGDNNHLIDSLAEQTNLDPVIAGFRVSYYAREVVPEWRRWFTALGDDEAPLPRI